VPPSKAGIRRFVLLTGVTIAVVVAPLAWYWARSGDPRLSTGSGLHMWQRMVVAQEKLAERGPATLVLLELLDWKDPRGVLYWWDAEKVLQERHGLDYATVVRLLGQVSREGILDAPADYFLFTLALAWRQFHCDPENGVQRWGETDYVDPNLEVEPPLGVSASGTSWMRQVISLHTVAWPIVHWLALAGLLLLFFLPQKTVLLAIACVLVAYVLGTAAVEMFIARYTALVVPFQIVLAAVPLEVLHRWFLSLRRKRSEARG
jgi:hypothetical protein